MYMRKSCRKIRNRKYKNFKKKTYKKSEILCFFLYFLHEIRRNYQYQRGQKLREQFVSGEALVNMTPTAVQPYLRLARYDKPIGYQV